MKKAMTMNSSDCIHEFTGSILKEETVKTLTKVGLEKTLIYEIEDSFPGYYGLESQDLRPNFIYLPTKSYYSYEDIKRVEGRIKKYFHETFDLSSAIIDMFNQLVPAIRLKYLADYDKLRDLQLFLREESIDFKKQKRSIHKTFLLKTDKVFLVKEEKHGIFLDQEEKENSYLTLPKHLKWKEFETITFQVKNNWTGNGFDAALAHFNRHAGVVDLVRVYSKENSYAFTRTIQEVYERFIK